MPRGGIIESNAALERVGAGRAPPSGRSKIMHATKPGARIAGNRAQPEDWASGHAVQKGETVLNQEMQIERSGRRPCFCFEQRGPHLRCAGKDFR